MSSTPGIPDLPEFKFDIDPDYLQMAMTQRQMYDAYVNVGFNEDQALKLTLQSMDGFAQFRAATAVVTLISDEEDNDGIS